MKSLDLGQKARELRRRKKYQPQQRKLNNNGGLVSNQIGEIFSWIDRKPGRLWLG